MFKSKMRRIVVPQSEHLKLVGALAMLWGNDAFDFPPLERGSVVAGMANHDRAYGQLDTQSLGEIDESEWSAIARRGFAMRVTDPVADLITRFHIRRLARYGGSAERRAMTEEFTQAIAEDLCRYDLAPELFERIDRITNLCDRISFAFCFEESDGGRVDIFPRNADDREVGVEYRVEGPEIRCTPWPFGVREHIGYITAYRLEGYPAELDPLILPYHLLCD